MVEQSCGPHSGGAVQSRHAPSEAHPGLGRGPRQPLRNAEWEKIVVTIKDMLEVGARLTMKWQVGDIEWSGVVDSTTNKEYKWRSVSSQYLSLLFITLYITKTERSQSAAFDRLVSSDSWRST